MKIAILHSVMRQNAIQVLRDAATVYKVDMDAIGAKVKQEVAVKEKARASKKGVAKAESTPTKKVKAHPIREPATWEAPFCALVLPPSGVAASGGTASCPPTRRAAIWGDGLEHIVDAGGS